MAGLARKLLAPIARLWPRGLRGRLALVMFAALTVAQLLTAWLNLAERDRLLYQAGGMQGAQRIADICRLLDTMTPLERRKVAAVFSGPRLSMSLDTPPLRAARESGGDLRFTMFESALRYALGPEMHVKVWRRDAAGIGASSAAGPPAFVRGPRFAPGAPPAEAGPEDAPMAGMPPHLRPGWRWAMRGPPRAVRFVVQVTLRDGETVSFDSFLSRQQAATPWRLALTLAALLGSVLVVTLIAVRWVTGPLSALAVAAHELGRDINRPPLPETGPQEVRNAAVAFNTMQQRLSRFLSDRARVLAAMSHDLKTPITRLRLRAELLDDETMRGKFEKDLGEMESMVAQTLDYLKEGARSEPASPVDLLAMIESIQADFREAGATFEIEGSAHSAYPGRPLSLRRCITNLAENAIRYGVRARVRLEDSQAAAIIRVLDEGPGLPEAELERAFEPFHRGEASRNRETGGTGLGLGIARNIARAHGGDLVLRNRPAGGLEAVLTLPRPNA